MTGNKWLRFLLERVPPDALPPDVGAVSGFVDYLRRKAAEEQVGPATALTPLPQPVPTPAVELQPTVVETPLPVLEYATVAPTPEGIATRAAQANDGAMALNQLVQMVEQMFAAPSQSAAPITPVAERVPTPGIAAPTATPTPMSVSLSGSDGAITPNDTLAIDAVSSGLNEVSRYPLILPRPRSVPINYAPYLSLFSFLLSLLSFLAPGQRGPEPFRVPPVPAPTPEPSPRVTPKPTYW